MIRYRVVTRSRCLQSPWKKLDVACLWQYEIVYNHENHFSLSYKNMMAFFYLYANFLALVVSASSVKTSKGIIFLPFCFIFLISASSFIENIS